MDLCKCGDKECVPRSDCLLGLASKTFQQAIKADDFCCDWVYGVKVRTSQIVSPYKLFPCLVSLQVFVSLLRRFQNNLSGIPPGCQNVWIQIRPNCFLTSVGNMCYGTHLKRIKRKTNVAEIQFHMKSNDPCENVLMGYSRITITSILYCNSLLCFIQS